MYKGRSTSDKMPFYLRRDILPSDLLGMLLKSKVCSKMVEGGLNGKEKIMGEKGNDQAP